MKTLLIKYRIHIIAVFAIIVLIASVSIFRKVNAGIKDLPDIIKSDRLTVVTDSSSLGFSLNKDSVYGFQYEIIKAFADSIGVELQISEQNDLKQAIEGLKDGEYDIVASLIPISTDLIKNGVVFTEPLIKSRQVLVQRIFDDSVHILLKKQFELANDTIYLQLNSASKMRIENLANEIAEKIYIVEVKNVSIETMVRFVSEGKIKNTICPEQLAKKLQKIYGNIDVSLPLGFNQNHAWVVNPESKELTDKLNSFLSDFIGSSAYWELYRKYY